MYQKEIHNEFYQKFMVACLNYQAPEPIKFLNLVFRFVNKYDDIRYYFYKNVGEYLRQLDLTTNASKTSVQTSLDIKKRKRTLLARHTVDSSAALSNAFTLLSQMTPPSASTSSSKEGKELLFEEIMSPKAPVFQDALFKKAFSDCWLSFLRHPHSPLTCQKILLNLHKVLIPNMVDPRLLIDFLVDAYDQGGMLSILALNGLFTLMTQFNL